MLAKPTKGISEVLDCLSSCAFTCEYKYDGERAQIHLMENGDVHVFSRNSEDNTTKYPDIAALMPRARKASTTSAIIDAEAVAVDQKTGQIRRSRCSRRASARRLGDDIQSRCASSPST